MFRHHGKARTLKHNLKIASLLSFVAGIVNVAGLLSVQILTTNITGHFAFFVDETFKLNFLKGLVFLLFIIFFFLGSFVSNFLVEIITRKGERFIFAVPIAIETVILSLIAIFGERYVLDQPNLIACCLLFAMGLQNSLVTKISNAVVRTTHLTGLVTDLGIELSQLFFYNTLEERAKLFSSIKLRMTIIGFFFIGGIVGGIFYERIGLYELLIGSFSLMLGLIYDNLKVRLILLKKKLYN
ncbi:MAG TPA: YoaK family protein [Chitinophagaceae bacterium]|nr:YoaK family protein [Chitinophagaceae bacterium]